MARWAKKSDDEKVKAELVVGICSLAKEHKWDMVALLSRAYTDLRKMETRQDQGNWGEELEELVRPAVSTDASQVRT